jgi:3-phosphoshikimate 1-carboxyvinyltransferase
MKIEKRSGLKKELSIPGDKSISHRAIMLGAIAQGKTQITNFLQGADCLSTIQCFQRMGISIENKKDTVTIEGKGLYGLSCPSGVLDVGNSGTTTRLMAGILSGQSFLATINGDASIQKRPMGRIITPLSQMGAKITSLKNNGCAPFTIEGGKLHGIHYQSPVASAQVKSAILLAGLYAEGTTSVTEPYVSRNHTELMLRYFGVPVSCEGTTASLTLDSQKKAPSGLCGQEVFVPGDISSAAYFIACGLLVPNSELYLKNVGINPTRNGILRVAQAMGGKITLENERVVSGEPVADLLVRSSSLSGTTIGGELIPTLIDEIPILAVMAAFADGTTVISDAAELKVKESNRIDTIVSNLSKMGASIEATDDGMIIQGGKPLYGAVIDTKDDHRIAMSFAVAGLLADGITDIQRDDCVRISYPDFWEDLLG